ncbi:ATPase, V1/A1 complex, subunit E [Thamnocephalis sphaerospora]|uniref:ATPase, V1/A1 complex, subunit E n=1 Tax=Thamnocephalis sphaerospora TaxID=78915 RepID=A0A4P9XTF0_9FUNG|nr:ATPase, V1/A1 complex, subunit E [Thamnocephalis sphaerospora]|eukprot:RKP09416.1 ATPase, V1/A1 complex, subunit E [Thamnocephalis sphaerospora]
MSSVARALNDEEVKKEMDKMCLFIRHEAMEKARELMAKADEDFTIEKGKIVQQESKQIEATAQRKTKQVEVQKKIARSNLVNKARLRTLAERENLLNELFETVREKLYHIPDDREKYRVLIKDLLLQGFLQLMEEEVSITCREADSTLVQDAIDEAKAEYEKMVQRRISPVLDPDNHLPKTSAGGVIIHALGGRIKCANTLESRLELLADLMLPDIRILLFGPSPSRKFYS